MSKEELSPALDQSAAWMEWLALVDEDDREAIATILEAIDITADDGLILFSQAIMVAVMRGHIAPPIASELRQWANTLFASQAARAFPTALEQGGTVTIAQTLSATIERQQKAALPAPSWEGPDVYDAEPEPLAIPKIRKETS